MEMFSGAQGIYAPSEYLGALMMRAKKTPPIIDGRGWDQALCGGLTFAPFDHLMNDRRED